MHENKNKFKNIPFHAIPVQSHPHCSNDRCAMNNWVWIEKFHHQHWIEWNEMNECMIMNIKVLKLRWGRTGTGHTIHWIYRKYIDLKCIMRQMRCYLTENRRKCVNDASVSHSDTMHRWVYAGSKLRSVLRHGCS